MLDSEAQERLIDQFRAHLARGSDKGDIEGIQGIEAEAKAGEPIDLSTVLAETAALKNEVRLQARQFKSALEQMQDLSEVLREQNQGLARDLERSRAAAFEAKALAERGLLLGLLELRDRLQAGLEAQTASRPTPLLRLFSGTQAYAKSLAEGSALTLQRLDELLASYRVRAITAVGQALDPQNMHAVATEWAPHLAPGLVLRELRRGFYQGNELLRAAEVIVNKKGPAA